MLCTHRITIVISIMLLVNTVLPSLLSSNDLYIVVTFPYLYEDMKSIACPGDVVIDLIKPGIDPHEYQLTPSDVNILRRANIIISTAHTHFELNIRKLVEGGELNSILIEVPYINGIKVFKNPSTGTENYHGILFYPENYIVFLNNLKHILSSLKPQCSKVYEENVNKLILRLQKIIELNSSLNKIAVLDSPVIQYIAEWLGLNVSQILMSEEEVPIVPKDIERVEKILDNYSDSIVVVTNGSKAFQYLINLASKYRREILLLPNPLLSSSIISMLENIASSLNTSTSVRDVHTTTNILPQLDVITIATIIPTMLIVAFLVIKIFKIKRS
ncbi:MAG: zinc ABC transporter substrate-binding protein [Ignisphaera sp.]